MDQFCQRNYNETCSFTCNTGYTSRNISEPNNVTCTTLSIWDRPLSSLCERLKCPATIPHGNVSTFCSREYNTYCSYYDCDSGYVLASGNRTLKCNATGQWEWWLQDLNRDFCINNSGLCPSDIKNGHLETRCGGDEGDRCSFSCDGGCKENPNVNVITCHNKTWDVDTDLLCTDCVQCHHDIPQGSVSMANCYTGQNCSYSCNDELMYAKNENITHVVCSNETNRWMPSIPSPAFTAKNDLCLARRCDTYIPNGHLSSSCSAEVGSVCRYTCDLDYHGNESEIYCQSRYRYKDHSPWTSEVYTYWSVDTRQLCTNNKQCPLLDSTPIWSLGQSCSRNPGDVCPYTCAYGYRGIGLGPTNQPTLTCTSSSKWNTSSWLLCEKMVCSSKILNGYVSCYTSINYNDTCNDYSCNHGYQRSKEKSSLTCNYVGQWEWTDPSPLKFCLGEEELCPSNIDGGRLSYDCHRHEGSICTYHCHGCRNYTAPSWLTCHNITWDTDTRYLCTECTTTTKVALVRCPLFLPDGRVNISCNRTPHSTCGYMCYRCKKQRTSLRCNSYGEWIGGNSACYCATCPSTIPNGYISEPTDNRSSLCDFKPGSECNVTCNEGCDTVSSYSICNTNGQWTVANNLCYCKESSTTTIAIVSSVLGVAALIIIVTCVYTAWHRRRSKTHTQSNSVSRPGHMQPSRQITTATTNTQETGDNSPTRVTNTNYIQGPPQYSELSVAKGEQTTPPPSYVAVSSHTLDVTQQTINQTVTEDISTPL